MEYLILFLVVLGCIAIVADAKKWDEQDHLSRTRKSIQKHANFQIGRHWIWEGTRREW